MTQQDVWRRVARLLAASACAGTLAAGGCAAAHHPARATTRPTTMPVVATTAVPVATVSWTDLRVKTIDGCDGPFAMHAWGGVSFPAGPHTLRVQYVHDRLPMGMDTVVSDGDVEVTFTAEAGHAYTLAGWPAAVHDQTDDHSDGREYAVHQTTRYITWEE